MKRIEETMNKKSIALLIPLLIAACAPVASFSASKVDFDIFSTLEVQQPEPTPSPEPNLYSLEYLTARSYGEGGLVVEYTWERREEFTRYKIVYDSDGLEIHGFVNVPTGTGPFPVVIALHGYIPASEYETLDYSTRYADSIARKGYIVLHPNLRNFPPSDSVGRVRDYHTGSTVDVLNLLAHVREMAGKEGIFEKADLNRMGIWGHSLGGSTAMRVVSLVDEIKAAVLYAAVSQRYSNSSAGFNIYNLESSQAAFSIHHGDQDDTISLSWSLQLCRQLEAMGKDPDCYVYEGEPHTFLRQGNGDPLFIQRTIAFYDLYLKTTENL